MDSGYCSMVPLVQEKRSPPMFLEMRGENTCIRLIYLWWFQNILVKLKKILNCYLHAQRIKTGSYFLMKQMPYLENALMFAMPMINMPTRKFHIYYSVLK